MPRPRSGGAYINNSGKVYARVRLGPNKRPSLFLPNITGLDAGRQRAAFIDELVAQLLAAGREDFAENVAKQAAAAADGDLPTLKQIVAGICAGTEKPIDKPLLGSVTFRQVVDRWTSGDLARLYPDDVKKKRSWRHDRYRLAHVPAELLDFPIAHWTTETYKRAMAALPATLGQTSRRHVAQVIHRVCELAIHPLGLLKTNPVPRLPMKGAQKLAATVLPRHVSAVAKTRTIDLGERVTIAFLAENGWRPSQALGRDEVVLEGQVDEAIPALTWQDLNFERAVAFLRRTKTTAAVEVELDDETVAALRAWKKLSPRSKPTDRVFVRMNGEPIEGSEIAEVFRSGLNAAGIKHETDPELFPEGADLAHREMVCAYDLRALFVTASLAQGRTPDWIMRHTLHVTLAMLETYRRKATHFAKHGPIVPAVRAIPELRMGAAMGAAGWRATSRTEPNLSKVHGGGLEPPRLAAVEPKLGWDVVYGSQRAGLRWVSRSGSCGRRQVERFAAAFCRRDRACDECGPVVSGRAA
jgi:integrase